MQKLVIIGSYGCGNKGDDAILEGILSQINPDKQKIYALSGKYNNLKKDFPIHSIKIRLNEGFTIPVLFSIILHFPLLLFHIITSSAILIGGGSLLHDHTPYNLPFFFLLQNIAQFFHKKVFYAGVGAGPISTPRGQNLCRKYLNRATRVFVRDIPDYQLLTTIGVTTAILSADLAFATNTTLAAANNALAEYHLTPKNYIAVTACQWFKSSNFWTKDNCDFSKDKQQLLTALKLIQVKTQLPLLFLPTVYHDYVLGLELSQHFETGFIVAEHSLNSNIMASLVANSRLLFAVRMHSIIFAIRSAVPFIASIYDTKVASLIKRVQMEDYIVNYDNGDYHELEQKLIYSLQNSSDISSRLKKQYQPLNHLVIDHLDNIISSVFHES